MGLVNTETQNPHSDRKYSQKECVAVDEKCNMSWIRKEEKQVHLWGEKSRSLSNEAYPDNIVWSVQEMSMKFPIR